MVAPGGGSDQEAAVAGTTSDPPLVPEILAEEMDKSRNLLGAYAQAKELLLSVGAMADVVAMENNIFLGIHSNPQETKKICNFIESL